MNAIIGAGNRSSQEMGPMAEESFATKDELPASLVGRIDKVCDRFESAWKSGATEDQRPRIEQYLGDTVGLERLALLRELIGSLVSKCSTGRNRPGFGPPACVGPRLSAPPS